MKRQLFLSIAGLLGIALVALSSFTSSKEVNVVNKQFQKREILPANQLSNCVEYYKTWSSFTQCYKSSTSTQATEVAQQLAILEKY